MLLKNYDTFPVLGYKVFSSRLNIINPEIDKVLINTFSPNSYGLALNDKDFEIALKNSDLLVLDGIGIAFGSILLNGKNIKKISGQDCFDHFMSEASQRHWKVFFLGSSYQTLKKITDRVHNEYPMVHTSVYSPPYKPVFSIQDNELMIKNINSFNPDVLFVGLTAPKQEKWAYQNRDLVNARIISTIGNVFDWYAGNSKRPARIWIKLRLEWLVRIFLRPEIFKRNIGNQMKFLRDLFFHITYIKRIKA
jgi:N-acetylglucosaminyldiphosphoundecaprenol N-acetyl-beta-D-mannosaminyltransferase